MYNMNSSYVKEHLSIYFFACFCIEGCFYVFFRSIFHICAEEWLSWTEEHTWIGDITFVCLELDY